MDRRALVRRVEAVTLRFGRSRLVVARPGASRYVPAVTVCFGPLWVDANGSVELVEFRFVPIGLV